MPKKAKFTIILRPEPENGGWSHDEWVIPHTATLIDNDSKKIIAKERVEYNENEKGTRKEFIFLLQDKKVEKILNLTIENHH